METPMGILCIPALAHALPPSLSTIHQALRSHGFVVDWLFWTPETLEQQLTLARDAHCCFVVAENEADQEYLCARLSAWLAQSRYENNAPQTTTFCGTIPVFTSFPPFLALLPPKPFPKDPLDAWLTHIQQAQFLRTHAFLLGSAEKEGIEKEWFERLRTASFDAASVALYPLACDLFSLHLTTKAQDTTQLHALSQRIFQMLSPALVPHSSLEAYVLARLCAKHQTVAFAESCTGGLLAKRLTDLSGSSEAFGFGFVTYANQAKEELVGVPSDILTRYGAVSEQTARAMAEGARIRGHADFGVAVTGIAGPSGGSVEKPVGLVYVAIAAKDGVWVRKLTPRKSCQTRQEIRNRTSLHAYDMLRRCVDALPMT